MSKRFNTAFAIFWTDGVAIKIHLKTVLEKMKNFVSSICS